MTRGGLIGYESERVWLNRVMDESLAGHGSLVLLGGQARGDGEQGLERGSPT